MFAWDFLADLKSVKESMEFNVASRFHTNDAKRPPLLLSRCHPFSMQHASS